MIMQLEHCSNYWEKILFKFFIVFCAYFLAAGFISRNSVFAQNINIKKTKLNFLEKNKESKILQHVLMKGQKIAHENSYRYNKYLFAGAVQSIPFIDRLQYESETDALIAKFVIDYNKNNPDQFVTFYDARSLFYQYYYNIRTQIDMNNLNSDFSRTLKLVMQYHSKSEILYNSEDNNPLDIFFNSRGQCFSFSMLHLIIERMRNAEEFTPTIASFSRESKENKKNGLEVAMRPVLIHTKGHVLFGYIRKISNSNYDLIGYETTVKGSGRVYFGTMSRLHKLGFYIMPVPIEYETESMLLEDSSIFFSKKKKLLDTQLSLDLKQNYNVNVSALIEQGLALDQQNDKRKQKSLSEHTWDHGTSDVPRGDIPRQDKASVSLDQYGNNKSIFSSDQEHNNSDEEIQVDENDLNLITVEDPNIMSDYENYFDHLLDEHSYKYDSDDNLRDNSFCDLAMSFPFGNINPENSIDEDGNNPLYNYLSNYLFNSSDDGNRENEIENFQKILSCPQADQLMIKKNYKGNAPLVEILKNSCSARFLTNDSRLQVEEIILQTLMYYKNNDKSRSQILESFNNERYENGATFLQLIIEHYICASKDMEFYNYVKSYNLSTLSAIINVFHENKNYAYEVNSEKQNISNIIENNISDHCTSKERYNISHLLHIMLKQTSYDPCTTSSYSDSVIDSVDVSDKMNETSTSYPKILDCIKDDKELVEIFSCNRQSNQANTIHVSAPSNLSQYSRKDKYKSISWILKNGDKHDLDDQFINDNFSYVDFYGEKALQSLIKNINVDENWLEELLKNNKKLQNTVFQKVNNGTVLLSACSKNYTKLANLIIDIILQKFTRKQINQYSVSYSYLPIQDEISSCVAASIKNNDINLLEKLKQLIILLEDNAIQVEKSEHQYYSYLPAKLFNTSLINNLPNVNDKLFFEKTKNIFLQQNLKKLVAPDRNDIKSEESENEWGVFEANMPNFVSEKIFQSSEFLKLSDHSKKKYVKGFLAKSYLDMILNSKNNNSDINSSLDDQSLNQSELKTSYNTPYNELLIFLKNIIPGFDAIFNGYSSVDEVQYFLNHSELHDDENCNRFVKNLNFIISDNYDGNYYNNSGLIINLFRECPKLSQENKEKIIYLAKSLREVDEQQYIKFKLDDASSTDEKSQIIQEAKKNCDPSVDLVYNYCLDTINNLANYENKYNQDLVDKILTPTYPEIHDKCSLLDRLLKNFPNCKNVDLNQYLQLLYDHANECSTIVVDNLKNFLEVDHSDYIKSKIYQMFPAINLESKLEISPAPK